jgi:PAS domain S-box-containing protein
MKILFESQQKRTEQLVARVLQLLQLTVFTLPALPLLYLQYWQNPTLRLVNYGFHEGVFFLAVFEGAGISYVSWLCYMRSGNVMLRRMTQAFIGFTVVYSLHGIFTPIADHNTPLFLLYGPFSRLTLGGCLLMAMLSLQQPDDTVVERVSVRQWLRWLLYLLGVVAFVALIAYSPIAREPWVRLLPESLAAGCNLAAQFMLYRLPLRSTLMQCFGMAVVWLVAASLAFVLSSPWNHQWWLAHGLSAIGFSILGYGILKGFQTTNTMNRVFTAEELFEDLAATNDRLKESMAELASANLSLTQQAKQLDGAIVGFLDLLNLLPDGIVVVSHVGHIVRVNSAAERLFGYPRDAMQGMAVEELVPASMRAAHKRDRQLYSHLQSVRVMGIEGDPVSCLKSDGNTFQAHLSIGNLHYDGKDCVATFIREASAERIHIESQRLLDQADMQPAVLLRSVLAEVPQMFFELQRLPDGQYRCRSFSTAALEGMHIERDQSDEQKTQQLFNQIIPTDLPSVIEAIERAAQTKSGWQTLWRHHVHGQGLQRLQTHAREPHCLAKGGLGWLCVVDIQREAHA